jgi:hypothetical protein
MVIDRAIFKIFGAVAAVHPGAILGSIRTCVANVCFRPIADIRQVVDTAVTPPRAGLRLPQPTENQALGYVQLTDPTE